jgi:hypothetical protein
MSGQTNVWLDPEYKLIYKLLAEKYNKAKLARIAVLTWSSPRLESGNDSSCEIPASAQGSLLRAGQAENLHLHPRD